MRVRMFILALLVFLGARGDVRAQAQVGTQNQAGEGAAQRSFKPSADVNGVPGAVPAGAHVIDGVAARIEDDIIMESEVRELSAFPAARGRQVQAAQRSDQRTWPTSGSYGEKRRQRFFQAPPRRTWTGRIRSS